MVHLTEYFVHRPHEITLYLKLLISQSKFVGPLEFEITRVACISKISSLYLASVAEQAGLNFTWSQTPKTGFLVTGLLWSLHCLAYLFN